MNFWTCYSEPEALALVELVTVIRKALILVDLVSSFLSLVKLLVSILVAHVLVTPVALVLKAGVLVAFEAVEFVALVLVELVAVIHVALALVALVLVELLAVVLVALEPVAL